MAMPPAGVRVTYQQQRRRCGKENCDCHYRSTRWHGHGPYWYAYWREPATGRVRSCYIGKRLPDANQGARTREDEGAR